MANRLPIGITSFKKIIENDFYFIDKSLFIKEIIDSKETNLLIPRPRRFGKSINLSMLKHFFETAEEKSVEGEEVNSNIFENLLIWNQGEEYHEYYAKHPVISLSFKNLKRLNWKTTISKFNKLISTEFARHKYLLEKDILSQEEKKYFQAIIDISLENEEYISAIAKLSSFLVRYHNKKVILLIDEYDKPIYVNYPSAFYDNIIELISTLFKSVLADNPFIEKSIITGMMMLSPSSLFKNINNFKCFSVIEPKFSEYFGLTNKDVEDILKDFDLVEKISEVKNWYENYVFDDFSVYNQWSVFNYVENEGKEFEAYWLNTSINVFVKDIIVKAQPTFKYDLKELLNQKTVAKPINDWVELPDFKTNDNSVWSFLFHSGYLKTNECIDILDKTYHSILIPNLEGKYLLDVIIEKWLHESLGSKQLDQFISALINGDIRLFESILLEFTQSISSYYKDTKIQNVFHALMLGLQIKLNDNYFISTKIDDHGRFCDVLLVPKDSEQNAVILKLQSPEEMGKPLEFTMKSLLKMAKQENVSEVLADKKFNNVLKIGAAVRDNEVMVRQLYN